MIAVFGASGFLGQYIYKYFKQKNNNTIGTYYSKKKSELIYYNLLEFNLSNLSKIKEINAKKIKYAVICTGQTNPDSIKKEKDHFEKLNVSSTITLAKNLVALDIFPIYISTDYVFDGKKGNYIEQDNRLAQNIYGKQKIQVEDYFIKNIADYLIVRISKLYSSDCIDENWAYIWIKSLLEKKQIICDTEQLFCPTHVEDICQSLDKLIAMNKKGIYHVGNNFSYSKYNLAIKICDKLKLNQTLIKRVDINLLGLLEYRPLKINLNCNKFIKETGYDFKDCLDEICNIKKRIVV